MVLSKIRLLERLFDVECRDCQRADHLEGKEANNISGIVIGLEIEMGRQVKELSESFGCVRHDYIQ